MIQTQPHCSQQKPFFSQSELNRLRAMSVEATLKLFNLPFRVDEDYRSYKNTDSKKLIVTIDSRQVELIITGEKWYDVESKRGGGGAIDLTMHLFREPFKAAAKRLIVSEVRAKMLED